MIETTHYHVEHLVAHLHPPPSNLSIEHIAFDVPHRRDVLGAIKAIHNDPTTRLLVLTGAPGQGKTHLCKDLLEDAGYSAMQTLARLCLDPAGDAPITLSYWDPDPPPDCSTRYIRRKRPIRIIDNLDQFGIDHAADLLVRALEDEAKSLTLAAVTVERLHAIVAQRPGRLGLILEALTRNFEEGEMESACCRVQVINLDLGSVAPADEDRSFLRSILESWTDYEGKWRSCGRCDAEAVCPIRRNRERLSVNDAEHEFEDTRSTWRDGLVLLIQVIEQMGHIVSFRDALRLAAYAITGGLRCADVLSRFELGLHSALDQHELPRSLFEAPSSGLSADPPLHAQLQRLDPGRVVLRDVDRELASVTPQSRRLAYFERPRDGGRRLGLRHHDRFLRVIRRTAEKGSDDEVLTQILAGLHAIQGLRAPDIDHLYIVEPETTIPRSCLYLFSRSTEWETREVGRITDVVDWLDREVVLCGEGSVTLGLNLAAFERLLHAVEAPGSVTHDDPVIRALLAKLSRFARQP